MERKLFCEISPMAYQISVARCRTERHIQNLFIYRDIARQKQDSLLPALITSHKSLIRRKLGNVDPVLQENKAVNLSIAAPKVSNILIAPNEVFSFWSLVGSCTEHKGYRNGLTISLNEPSCGIGGGMCQFTNLIHWMVLHTPLTIIEHHHHDNLDLFPDFSRQVPFGVGTSIFYNYLDYRFRNDTDMTFQLTAGTDDRYLFGEIRAERPLEVKYHIRTENEYFSEEKGIVYRNGDVFRNTIDKRTGTLICHECIKKNHARVMYDSSSLHVIHAD